MKEINPITLKKVKTYWEKVLTQIGVPMLSQAKPKKKLNKFLYNDTCKWYSEEQSADNCRIRIFGFPFEYHRKDGVVFPIVFMFKCVEHPVQNIIVDIYNLDDIKTIFTTPELTSLICLKESTSKIIHKLINEIEQDCFQNFDFPEFLSKYSNEYERVRAIEILSK